MSYRAYSASLRAGNLPMLVFHPWLEEELFVPRGAQQEYEGAATEAVPKFPSTSLLCRDELLRGLRRIKKKLR